MSKNHTKYYVPESSCWPIVGSIALFLIMIGIIGILPMHAQGSGFGGYILAAGVIILVIMLFGWFSDVIRESQAGLYSEQLDRSFRQGMLWFIFSEIFFFGIFFGALFYARVITVPWMGGEFETANSILTQQILWPDFVANWPLLENPDSTAVPPPYDVIGAWGLPALNTAILLTSGVTVTWAHWGLLENNRSQLIKGLTLTVLLGVVFLAFQAYEYYEAYEHYGLTLGSGIYGTTFFLLTGFHGVHVTLGALMLFVVLLRSIKGHFDVKSHFAFEAAAWYWHFVDVVWLLLFVFVYWL